MTTMAARIREMNAMNRQGRISVREIDVPKPAPEPAPRFAVDLDEPESDEVDEQHDAHLRSYRPDEPAPTPLEVARAHMQQQAQLVDDLRLYRRQCETRIEATKAEIAQVNEALAALGHVEVTSAV